MTSKLHSRGFARNPNRRGPPRPPARRGSAVAAPVRRRSRAARAAFRRRRSPSLPGGGSVRDAVLGRLGTDLDFTTDARPEHVQALLRGWADHLWDTGGLAFGTVSAGKSVHQIEITTFRSDSYDRVGRNPEVTFGDSLDGDLVRRDFTVNAMAVRIGPTGARSSSTRSTGSPRCSTGSSTRPPRRPSASPTIRCGCCVPRDSFPSWGSARRRGYPRRSGTWRARSSGSPRNGSVRNWTS